MRVLFLNDTSLVSGAERCLLDLLPGLGADVEALVACPRGPLFDAVSALGIAAVAVAPTTGSFRLHALHTPRALARIATAAASVRRLAARERIDLVHANTLRSGLVAAAARRAAGPPFAAFIHDALAGGLASRLTSAAIRSQAAVLLANSAFSSARFGLARDDPRLRIVYNPIDLDAFDPGRHERPAARARLDLDPDDLVLAVVAQITPWKGQREALQTLAAMLEEQPRARLVVVGEAKFVARATRYDNRAYLAELRALARHLGVEPRVRWLGDRGDVPAILAAVDVLLVPSWAEPFGRVVVEGMAMGCLVAATSIGGPSEVIDDGVDGLLLEPRDPQGWARALCATVAHPEAMRAIRSAARPAVQRFSSKEFVKAMLDAYRSAVS
jgi:glycosyltransferase involved in cell wall biosynthesis